MRSDTDRPGARPAAAGPGAALALIRQRNFGPYFVGAAISACGTWFQNLAASVLVFRLTGSLFLLGVVSFAQFAPLLVLAPWSGSVADRVDRRRLVIASQVISSACAGSLAVFAWLGLASTSVVIAFTLLLGLVTAFGAPATEALIASLVAPEDLSSAVGLKSMTWNIARVAGPAAAGVTIATLGIPFAFAINSLSFLALAVGVIAVKARPQALSVGGAHRFRDSIGLLRREPGLAALLITIAVVGFASDPVNTLAPAYAQAFGRPDTEAALVIGVFGAGAVTAALFMSGRVLASPTRTVAMLSLLGGGLVLFSACRWLVPALVFLFISGFGYLAANTAVTSRLQLSVHESYRGRIMALWTVAFLGLRPLASLADGSIASAFGVRSAGVALAVPALVVAMLMLIWQRHESRGGRGGS